MEQDGSKERYQEFLKEHLAGVHRDLTDMSKARRKFQDSPPISINDVYERFTAGIIKAAEQCLTKTQTAISAGGAPSSVQTSVET